MKLERKEAELFYNLWFPLMNFVNKRYRVCPGTGKIAMGKGIAPPDAKAIANYIWEHTEVIDEYLAGADLPAEHREIIEGWKMFRSGKYIMERHLKRGSVFISLEDNSVYMVQGLFSSFDEMFDGWHLPLLVDAVLLPFLGKVITDGLMIPHRISFGVEYTAEFKKIYMNAKRNGDIKLSLQ
ncbi:MAG: hypothetical protein ACI3XA_07255 [Clostridia bacterium]